MYLALYKIMRLSGHLAVLRELSLLFFVLSHAFHFHVERCSRLHTREVQRCRGEFQKIYTRILHDDDEEMMASVKRTLLYTPFRTLLC